MGQIQEMMFAHGKVINLFSLLSTVMQYEWVANFLTFTYNESFNS